MTGPPAAHIESILLKRKPSIARDKQCLIIKAIYVYDGDVTVLLTYKVKDVFWESECGRRSE